jgi:small neutral amino acid transporter SnatA (MarC family)
MYELDHAQTLPSPVQVTRSEAVVKQPVKYAANVTGTVSPKAVTPQTTPASATPEAASAAVASVAVAPAAVAPHMSILLLSLVTLVCIISSLLLLKFRLQNSRSN